MSSDSGTPARAHQRVEIARAAMQHFLDEDGQQRPFPVIAERLGVPLATLSAHFQDFEGLFAAAFEQQRLDAEGVMKMARELSSQAPGPALSLWCRFFRVGWEGGLKMLFHVGLTSGMTSAPRGHVVVQQLLEPTLDVLESLLTVFDTTQQLDVPDARTAALALSSPVIVALLHQDSLNGVSCRPLDFDVFLQEHVRRFLRAHEVVDAP